MELFSHLSDDQIALLGCAAALVTTSTIMSLSHFLGRSRQAAPNAGAGCHARRRRSERTRSEAQRGLITGPPTSLFPIP